MKTSIRSILLITLLALIGGPAESQLWAGSRLLLPYFEVELDNAETTTLFALTNTADEAITVRASIYSNWGIPILETTFGLDAREVLTVNLYRWLAEGKLLDRTLPTGELEHVKSAYCGEPSPADGRFYSDEVSYHRAVGYIYFQVISGPAERDVLIGDFFVVSPGDDSAQGQAMLNVDPADECGKICFRHGLRFLSGGFDAGTEIFIWTQVEGVPSESAYYPDDARVHAEVLVYDERGNLVDTLWLDLLPVQLIKVGDLGLPEEFGWFDIRTAELSFISVRYGARDRFSVGLKTFCLRIPTPSLGPGISLQKLTNGVDADFPPGPAIPVGAPVHWEYHVTNTGGEPLTDILVTDSRGVAVTCPQTGLEPGGSMTCTGSGIAEPCQYENLGTVVGTAPDGGTVRDDDPSHYFGTLDGVASIDLEKATRDGGGSWHDADFAPGPEITEGAPVAWRYVVENDGTLDLTNLVVDDNQGVAVSCPQTSLAAGATMTCTGDGSAPAGIQELFQYQNIGSVTATAVGACGETVAVSDSDPSHYFVDPIEECPAGRVFVAQDDPSDLFGADALLRPDPVTICSFAREINNVGYRKTDNRLYGLHLTGYGNSGGNAGIVQIDPATCALVELATTGLPTGVRFDAGDVSIDGQSMFINLAGRANDFYRVDLSSIDADGVPTSLPLQAVKLTVTGAAHGRVNDWAYNPADGNLYGGDRDHGEVARLVQVGPTEYARTDFPVANLPVDTSEDSMGAYGGALFNPQGKLVLHLNSGTAFQIDVLNPTVIFSQSPASASPRNDGAACWMSP